MSEFKAKEIIYGQDSKIIGLKDLDPKSLILKYSESLKDFIWVQFPNNKSFTRVLFRSQISTNII